MVCIGEALLKDDLVLSLGVVPDVVKRPGKYSQLTKELWEELGSSSLVFDSEKGARPSLWLDRKGKREEDSPASWCLRTIEGELAANRSDPSNKDGQARPMSWSGDRRSFDIAGMVGTIGAPFKQTLIDVEH